MNSNNKKTKLNNEEKEKEEVMLIAIPKKGRLYDKCAKLLEGCDLKYTRSDRLDIAYCSNLPIAIVFLPAADIAKYVADGNVELGITGLDIVQESEVKVEIIEKLGFGKCKLALQAPIGKYSSAADVAGGRIHTSFPNVTKNYFEKIDAINTESDKKKKTSVTFLSGSVEIACSLGLADAVVDLVETGTTMKAAGLEIVATLMETEAVLIKNPHSKFPDLCKMLDRRIRGYIAAQDYQMITYNIPRSKLKDAEKITPGKRSPTIAPLEDSDWLSVSALVSRKDAVYVMDKLQELGAEDILLTDVKNCRVGIY